MSTENIIIAHLENAKQTNLLKTLLKALNIKFEIQKEESPYDPTFVKKIEKSKKEFREGKSKVIKTEDLWK